MPISSIDLNQSIPQQAISAYEQTKKLQKMPIELSSVFSRLSSQHHLSEYNTLKRVILSPIPPPPPPQQPLPIPSSQLLQRSLSTPPFAVPPPSSTSTKLVPSSLFQNLFRSNSSPPEESHSQSLPVSRATTPPPPHLPHTSLTPTLVNFAISAPTVVDHSLTNGNGAMERRPVVVQTMSSIATPNIVLLPGMQILNGVAVKTSISHPMNISPVLPPELLPSLSSLIFSHKSSTSLSSSPPPPGNGNNKPRSPLSPVDMNGGMGGINHQAFKLDVPKTCNIWNVLIEQNHPHPHPQSNGISLVEAFNNTLEVTPSHVLGGEGEKKVIGNFYLSSCPGKKVRLEVGNNSLVNRGGRNPICRDLKLDLERMKLMGVRVVICCLDDQELAFLGAPWAEYARTAELLELVVIRIPMVEGFAPSSPGELDFILNKIVKHHTLRGENVLAHCRGGIGRAGAIACCWMLKCGFVGGFGIEDEQRGENDSLRIVERVIDIIRKRRSVKSIETAQQVHFLVEYTEFLKLQAIPLPAVELV